jgi:hypothetical protein
MTTDLRTVYSYIETNREIIGYFTVSGSCTVDCSLVQYFYVKIVQSKN